MKTLEESVACSMDCEDAALLPFLPYILQDFFEIGTSADTILNMIRKNITVCSSVLDLGCGKGAVSIALASELGCCCIGIDAIPEFIQEATCAKRSNSWASSTRLCSDRSDLYSGIVPKP